MRLPSILLMSSLVLGASAAMAAGGANSAKASSAHNARNSLDWSGLYVGTLPCASCPGYYTELKLNPKRSYRISETAEDKGEFSTWVHRGRFAWNAGGNSIRMGQGSEQRQYLVRENALEQLALDGSRVTGDLAPLYRLEKADRFVDALGQMLVLRGSLQPSADGQTVHFQGRENFAQPKAAEQRSISARYSLNCQARSYEMADIQYFSALNGQGKGIKLASDAQVEIALGKDDSRMQQVFARYCPAAAAAPAKKQP